MKIINQSHEVIDRSKYTAAPLIEVCGRTCYKSEDKITDQSADKFVKHITARRHLSVLEHSTVAIQVPFNFYVAIKFCDSEHTKYLAMSKSENLDYCIVSANLRAWFEFLENIETYNQEFAAKHKWSVKKIRRILSNHCPSAYRAFFGIDVEEFSLGAVPEIRPISTGKMSVENRKLHEYKTVRFITNRGVTHELVRHRPASYSQESTRYVNYGGDDIVFIKPVWIDNIKRSDLLPKLTDKMDAKAHFIASCKNDELFYKVLLKKGWRPEQARECLPNSLKTEIVVTANLKEWKHILNLRTAKAAHPQIRELMLGVERDFRREMSEIF